MKKAFENKHFFDPGRFRYRLTLMQQQAVSDGSGGSTQALVTLLTTQGVKEPYTRRYGEFGNIDFVAGAKLMQSACYFVIRFRRDFMPAEDMLIACDGLVYAVVTNEILDTPPKYYRVLAMQRDISITT